MKKLLLAALLCAATTNLAFAGNDAGVVWGTNGAPSPFLESAQMHAQYGVVAGQVEDTRRGMLSSRSINCSAIGSSTNNTATSNGDSLATIDGNDLDAINSGDVTQTCNFNSSVSW